MSCRLLRPLRQSCSQTRNPAEAALALIQVQGSVYGWEVREQGDDQSLERSHDRRTATEWPASQWRSGSPTKLASVRQGTTSMQTKRGSCPRGAER